MKGGDRGVYHPGFKLLTTGIFLCVSVSVCPFLGYTVVSDSYFTTSTFGFLCFLPVVSGLPSFSFSFFLGTLLVTETVVELKPEE